MDEQRPSKERLNFSWTWDADARNWRISMVDMGDGFMAGYDHLALYYERRLIAEIERLNSDLAWIRRRTGFWGEVPQSKPAHEREMPHCSTCACPPYSPWQPIETAPKRIDAIFWIRAGTKEDGRWYCNTDGDPILSCEPARIHVGQYGTWSSLMVATHWMPLPPGPSQPPRDGQ